MAHVCLSPLSICTSNTAIFYGYLTVLDVPMLQASDRGYVVIDEEKRNRSMLGFIRSSAAAQSSCHRLYQLTELAGAAGTVPPHTGLCAGSLKDLKREIVDGKIHMAVVADSTSQTAKILATQSRRADFSGPMLQSVHVEIGRVLADKLIDTYSSLAAPGAGLWRFGSSRTFRTASAFLASPLPRSASSSLRS